MLIENVFVEIYLIIYLDFRPFLIFQQVILNIYGMQLSYYWTNNFIASAVEYL